MKAHWQAVSPSFSQYSRKMSSDNPKAFRRAVAGTLSAMAYQARQQAIEKELPKAFTLRNTYTKRSVQYNKASGGNVNTMFSVVGQVKNYLGGDSDYLGVHEKGGTIKPKKGKYLRKGTQYARTSRSYKKKIAKRFAVSGAKTFLLASAGRRAVFTRQGKKLRMVYNLESQQTKVKATNWLSKSAKYAIQKRHKIFKKEFTRALRR